MRTSAQERGRLFDEKSCKVFAAGAMRRTERYLVQPIGWLAIVCSLLGWEPAACLGQRTIVRDAGGGRKIELIYDDSGQVVETRTVDLAGRLQVRVEHERRSGFLVPQEITTSYWPDGKAVRSVARVGYDENGNFTSEVIALFNPAGSQTGGSKLTHDPFKGIYRCSKWDTVRQDYQPSECPSTEQSAAAGEEVKMLTYDEAMKQLEIAWQTRREEQKAQRMERKSPVQSPIVTVKKEIGLILPAQPRPGERVSGSVVEDPEKYDGRQDLGVIRMDLPLESQGEAATLRGWAFEAAGEGPQRADGPLTFTVPHASEFSVTLRQLGNPARAVSRLVSVAPVTVAQPSPQQNVPISRAFEAAALCLKGDLYAVRGPFSGDSTKTLVAFGSRPAPIIAETEDTAYIGVPAGLKTGPTHLIVADGSLVAALPVDVAELSFSPKRRDLLPDQTVLVHATLSGPEDLPDEQWRAGIFPPSISVERARNLVAFEPPREGREGVILLVIWNAAPEAVSLRGSKDQAFVFELTPDSFKSGGFKYQFVVAASKSAGLALQGTVMPFLAPIRGQEFAIRPSSPAD